MWHLLKHGLQQVLLLFRPRSQCSVSFSVDPRFAVLRHFGLVVRFVGLLSWALVTSALSQLCPGRVHTDAGRELSWENCREHGLHMFLS